MPEKSPALREGSEPEREVLQQDHVRIEYTDHHGALKSRQSFLYVYSDRVIEDIASLAGGAAVARGTGYYACSC